jgi:hypothetical protein
MGKYLASLTPSEEFGDILVIYKVLSFPSHVEFPSRAMSLKAFLEESCRCTKHWVSVLSYGCWKLSRYLYWCRLGKTRANLKPSEENWWIQLIVTWELGDDRAIEHKLANAQSPPSRDENPLDILPSPKSTSKHLKYDITALQLNL